MKNYETFSTTADSGIRFKGRDFRELYENALRGLNILLFGAHCGTISDGGSVPFRFQGDGPETVLVNFLTEVLFQVYQKGMHVVAAEFGHADRFSLDAVLFLAPCRRTPRVEIKSATYHNLRVEEKRGWLRASIVFDV